MLADDQSEFLDWLATTGDVWAGTYRNDAGEILHEPLPAREFVQRFADRIRADDYVHLYLGHRADVLKPRIHTVTIRSTAEQIRRREIDEQASLLICCRHGLLGRGGILQRTSVYYYPSFLKGNVWVKKPEEWVKWARKVIAWLRRRATEKVPVYGCNDSLPATPRAGDAVRGGTRVV